MHLRNAMLVLLVACLSVFIVACSDDDDGGNGDVETPTASTPENGSTGAAPPDGNGSETSLTITAENNEFDKDELTAPASTEVSLEMDNQDAGVLHNVSVYQSSDAAESIFKGDLVTGVTTTTYTFETPEAGEYFFRCDVHPDTMTGAFITE